MLNNSSSVHVLRYIYLIEVSGTSTGYMHGIDVHSTISNELWGRIRVSCMWISLVTVMTVVNTLTYAIVYYMLFVLVFLGLDLKIDSFINCTKRFWKSSHEVESTVVDMESPFREVTALIRHCNLMGVLSFFMRVDLRVYSSPLTKWEPYTPGWYEKRTLLYG